MEKSLIKRPSRPVGNSKEMAQLQVQASGTVEGLMQSITIPEGNQITWARKKKDNWVYNVESDPKGKGQKMT